MTTPSIPKLPNPLSHFPTSLLPIIILAFALRVWSIDLAPPGLTHDEAAHLHDAQRIWDGYRPIYLTSAYGREPLYDYASAPLVGLVGMRVSVGRIASAMWGTLLVALTFAWAARALDRPTATLSAALIALSFWPLSTSRQALRSITNPVALLAALLLFWQAIYPPADHHQRRRFIPAGVILGLSCYTYMPARITWLAPAIFGLLYLALTDRPRWRHARSGVALMLLTMLLVAAPLLVYLAQHPELEVRVDELAAPLRALREGDPGPLWNHVRESSALLSHSGDMHWMYNISGRALLPPALAALFYLGLALITCGILRRRQRPAYALLLLWLILGLSPALVTGLESSSLRAIAAQPAVYIIVALPPAALGRRLWPHLGQWARAGIIGLTIAALALLGAQTARDYFNTWATHRDTRTAYHAHVVQIARYLQDQSDDTPAAISTIYPGPLHDPYATDVVLSRANLKKNLRWYDARFALVIPDVEQSRAIFPALAPLDAALQPIFQPSARLLERVELQPDDISPWFEVYTWSPSQVTLPLAEPIDVGHVIAFIGHQLNTPTIPPGGTVEILTFWRVLDGSPLTTNPLAPARSAGDQPLVFFTHILGSDGQVIAQQDRLDAPAWNWTPGDVIVQLHRFSANAPPGQYPLEIGIYTDAENYPRLPVYGPAGPSDHILLPPIEIIEP